MHHGIIMLGMLGESFTAEIGTSHNVHYSLNSSFRSRRD